MNPLHDPGSASLPAAASSPSASPPPVPVAPPSSAPSALETFASGQPPAWAAEKSSSLLGWFDAFVGLGFAFIAPMIVVATAMLFEQWLLVAFLPFFFFLMSMIHRSQEILGRSKASLEKFPVIKDLLRFFEGLAGYYYENKPRGTTASLLLLLTAPITVFLVPSFRKEMKLYIKLCGILALAPILQTLTTYHDIFPPYLRPVDAISLVLVEAIFVLLFFPVFLQPMTSSAFRMAYTGQTKRLRLFTSLSFGLTLVWLVGFFALSQKQGGFKSSELIKQKLQVERYQKDLASFSTWFLGTYLQQAGLTSAEPKAEEEKAERFRLLGRGLLPGSQGNLFTILSAPGPSGGSWDLLIYRVGEKGELFALRNPLGRVVLSPPQVPPMMAPRLASLFKNGTHPWTPPAKGSK